MRKFSTTAAAAAIVALVSLPAAAQSGTGATDQAGSQAGSSSGSTSGASSSGDTSTAGTSGQSSTTPGSATTGSSGSTSTEKHAGSAKSGASAAFLKEAAQGGLAEVQLGQLATQKASNDDVKKFGQMMVDDHTKANNELKDVAQKKNVTVPTELSAKDKATMNQLEKLSGDAFDKAYMHHMVQDHTKDVAAFKHASSSSDSDVQQFASSTLPTLQKHLQDAKDIQQKLGGGASMTSNSGHKGHKATGTSGTSGTGESGSGTSGTGTSGSGTSGTGPAGSGASGNPPTPPQR